MPWLETAPMEERLDELAGVLGHEIGHVIQRHSVKQMQSSEKIGIVATTLRATNYSSNESSGCRSHRRRGQL